MTKEELLTGLQSIANQMRRWEAAKWEVDGENEGRPPTEQWTHETKNIFGWRQEIETLLVEYRKAVAQCLKRKPSQQWTAEEMINLLGESV